MAKQENQDDPLHKARSVALRLLARREHSRMELTMKLRQRRIDREVIDRVLDEYEQKGWLDDTRFADVYARQRMDLGYGPLRILAELQQRGVDVAPDCLEQVSEQAWRERAVSLRDKRFGLDDLREDWNEKMRQARFLTRRGFSVAQVEWALEARHQGD
ncbi:regulatory protein RecX [Marinobacter salinisoli]|uniref:Regulatory protein RecX n=1 Tax=Marinobacter salinisoli TaxID=2769486 RepID=A0ABX7MPN9_9GAMM|nr:regulatory protein RecX [Marinobacter salinisoli]QSP94282.1 regulatory protein RecX [Marinobacter salinisoli]